MVIGCEDFRSADTGGGSFAFDGRSGGDTMLRDMEGGSARSVEGGAKSPSRNVVSP